METHGSSISISTAPASAGNCHIRAVSFCILILGAAPVHLVLCGPASIRRRGPWRRGQTSARRSAHDATLGLAEAEVPGGRRGGVGYRACVAVREPIVQAPHTRGGTAARPVIVAAAGDNNHSVLILVIVADAGTRPPGHPDALAFVGDDHVARCAARAVRELEFCIAARDAAAAAQGQTDVYERGGYTAVNGALVLVV